jgi:diadenosine tetraphosphatase ApaH/serine/threonine PP2A family protein phosphatase
MKLALISDIHANLEALQAVLRDIDTQKVDTIHCLGDVIGYGCDPVRCVHLVEKHCDVKLMGNHEYVALGLLQDEYLNNIARESMQWTAEHLSDRETEAISDYAMDAELEGAYLVHSSPFEPEQWHYILSIAEARQGFSHFDHFIGFCGHSHVPMIFSQTPDGGCSGQIGHDIDPASDNRYLVNIGSVGQPRDNDPRSCYVIYDSDELTVRYRRVDYDIDMTQQKMAEARLPGMLADRLRVGR